MLLLRQALIGTLLASAVSMAFATVSASHATAQTAALQAPVSKITPTLTSTSTSNESDSQSGGVTQALAFYAHDQGPIRIVGEAAARSITVPISAREVVRSVMLHLVATNSVSLLSQRSQLVVRVDDRTVAQFPLSPQQPELSADIRVPADLLTAGYNSVSFAVAQHATNECEEKDAPELWTEIDTSRSTLQLDTAFKALDSATLRLSDISNLIDPRQSTPSPLTIMTAAPPKSDLQMETGGLLAQGIALRLRYLNAKLSVQTAHAGTGAGILPGLSLLQLKASDVLLAGTREQLRPYLDPKIISQIDGAFLGIYPKPDDPHHFILIVSGVDDGDVNLASRAFAHADMPLPNESTMIVHQISDEKDVDTMNPGTVEGNHAYLFRDLGLKSVTLGQGDSEDLTVRVPGDFYAAEDAEANLTLNFAEGAKMRTDSVLNVFLNGQFERTVALDQQQGNVVTHYRMPIPLRHFHPGENTITLRPVLVPLITDRCTLRQSGNLLLSIFDDSSLHFPAVSHFTTLPDLHRLAASGFPYVVNGAGAGLTMQMKSTDNDTLEAVWTLLGKLAQNLGRPLTDTQVTSGAPLKGRNVIIVGAQPTLSENDLAGAPWQPGKSMRLPVKGLSSVKSKMSSGIGWLLGGADASDDVQPKRSGVDIRGNFPLSRQLFVMQYRGDADTTTTLITAATPAAIATGMDKLIDPQYWNDLSGDVDIVNFDSPTLLSSRVGPSYQVGHIDTMARFGYEISSHPIWGYALIALSLLLLAVLSSVLLLRYKREHHGSTQD